MQGHAARGLQAHDFAQGEFTKNRSSPEVETFHAAFRVFIVFGAKVDGGRTVCLSGCNWRVRLSLPIQGGGVYQLVRHLNMRLRLLKLLSKTNTHGSQPRFKPQQCP
jgi:hypothetical protein